LFFCSLAPLTLASPPFTNPLDNLHEPTLLWSQMIPPDRDPLSGSYTCLRCGFSGRTLSGLPPKCCAKCRSAYWDRPPKLARAHKPPQALALTRARSLLPPPDFARDRLTRLT
jgi:hypothetical protein